ncbi:hypothetical protein [Phytoactinopolyspora halotolerans]|uniref:hypothetical protein n=1 Tax=Phytoactinopolyspora halotolerans TaxID=1981512 RepID=UPI001C20B420|nr:hypothetical protein [Phytoactinopolyspora halotolerans]
MVIATAELLYELAVGQDGKRVLLISHSANRWALQCLLGGARLEDLVEAPFHWQEGWEYVLPTDQPPIAESIRVKFGLPGVDRRYSGST